MPLASISWVWVVLVSGLFSLAVVTETTWAAATGFSVIALIVAARYWYVRTGRLLEPGWLIGAALFMYYHFRIATLLLTDAPRHDVDPSVYALETLNLVSILATVAILVVFWGFRVGYGKGTSREVPRYDGDEKLIPVLCLFFAASLLATLTKAELGFVHYGGRSVLERSTSGLNQLLTLFESVGWLSYFALVWLPGAGRLHGWSGRIRSSAILIQLLVAAAAGGGGPLFIWALPLLLRWDRYGSVSGHQRSMRMRAQVVAAGLLVFVGLLYVKAVVREYGNSFGIAPSLPVIVQNLDILPAAVAAVHQTSWLSEISGRFIGADSLGVIIKEIESGRHQLEYGRTLALLPAAFVPRVFWPEKPDIALGMHYTDHWWRTRAQVTEAGEGTQGTAFCLPGEFYMNFGWIGAAFGMLLVGAIAGRVYRSLETSPNILPSLVLLTALFDPLVRWEFSFASWIAGMTQTTLLFSFFWLCARATAVALRQLVPTSTAGRMSRQPPV